MAELERELRAVAPLVQLPSERDLWPGIAARLDREPGRNRLRIAVTIIVAAAVAVGIAFAVPPARSAILRFLGLEGVTIVRVEKLPPVTSGAGVSGTQTTLDQAARQLGFPPLLPDIGPPDAVYLDLSQHAVLLLYGKPLRLRLEETLLPVFNKLVTFQQTVERVRVNGGRGVWVSGTHVVDDFFGQPRLSGSALLWEQNYLSLRLEGRLTKAQALRIAGSIHSG